MDSPLFGSVLDWFRNLGPATWLVVAGLAGAGALLAAMAALAIRHARLKHEIAETPRSTAERDGGVDTSLGLEGGALSPIDRVFPRKPGPFLAMVGIISCGTWLVGYGLAPEKSKFVTAAEWWFQPFYIAAHLVALRVFINVFTRNFAAGVAHLDISRPQAMRGIRPILGKRGAGIAALVALPFSYFDFQYLFGARYQRMGEDGQVLPVDYLMWGIWTLEWFVNAFIWVLLLGFMVKNWTTIRRATFRAPVHVVLEDKHYRPFLQMSAQSSTVVLLFSLVTVLYLVYTGGELTDYLGLGITVVLLVVGFVPPWLLLRNKVDEAVRRETLVLRWEAGLGATGAGARSGGLGFAQIDPVQPGQEAVLGQRVDQAVALLRLWHLHNLYGNLGHTEAKAILFRLLAPAATIGWQAMQTQGELVKRLGALLGVK